MLLGVHHGCPLPIHQFLVRILLEAVDDRVHQAAICLASRLRGNYIPTAWQGARTLPRVEGQQRPVGFLSKSRLHLEYHLHLRGGLEHLRQHIYLLIRQSVLHRWRQLGCWGVCAVGLSPATNPMGLLPHDLRVRHSSLRIRPLLRL